MKTHTLIFFLLFSALYKGQMVNPGFEQTAAGAYTSAAAVSGWTIDSGTNNGTCTYTNSTPGSSEFSIVSTPFNNFPFQNSPLNIIGHSPLGGIVVACLGDTVSDNTWTRLRQTFTVTAANTILQFAYAGYWEDGGPGHSCCDNPGISISLYDKSGIKQGCSSMSLSPYCSSYGATFSVIANTTSWCNWQSKVLDLTPYLGEVVTIEFKNTDCSFSDHFGITLIDVTSNNKLVAGSSFLYPMCLPNITFARCTLNLCSGANYAELYAPNGYYAYQWSGPSGTIAAPYGNSYGLTVNSPTVGSVFTVTFTSCAGCEFSKSYTITNSQVSIVDIETSGSCPNSNNGSATITPYGSSGSFNYSWLNSTNSVVSTASVASGLGPGVYSLTVSSAPGCGTAVTTVTITNRIPTLQIIPQPYCTTPVPIATSSAGVNYQWYNYNTPISSATLSSYTANSISNGMKYRVAYDFQGCRDSIEYVLLQLNPGILSIPTQSIRPACTSVSSGSATIGIQPSYTGAQTNYQFTVNSTGTMSPFTASATNATVSSFPVSGLAGGIYTVNASDGYCPYALTFTVGTFQFSTSLSTTAATICPGENLPASFNVSPTPSSNQFKYQWYPASAIQATANAGKNATLSPVAAAAGSYVTQVFSVIVTPSISPCPETQTLMVTRTNPTVFPISQVQPLCTSFTSLQLQVSPPGGTVFNNPLTPGLVDNNAVIHPEKANAGINSFTYAINISTCVASASQTFLVSEFHTAQLFAPKITICENSPPTLLDPLTQDITSSSWSGPGVSGNTFTPALVGIGIYSLAHKSYSLPDSALCPDSAALVINVEAPPMISVASGSICSGENFTINPSGAVSYSFSAGSPKVSPLTTTSYSVWGLSKSGCKTNSAVVITITVTPTPSITIQTSSGLPCAGEQITLTATGASNYTWMNGPPTASFETIVSFPVMFKVNGSNGDCFGSAFYLQNVLNCTGIDENNSNQIEVYPNPASDVVRISTDKNLEIKSVEIINITGMVLLSAKTDEGFFELPVYQLEHGVYLLRLFGEQKTLRYHKLIIE